MRDRELRGAAADFVEATGGAAMKPQLRRAAGPAHDFDVTPEHALGVSGAERLHRRFFRREAAGKMNLGKPAAQAVLDFAVGEDPVREALAVPADRGGDSRNFRRVEAESDDGHSPKA